MTRTCEQRLRLIGRFESRQCGVQVGLRRWFDTSGNEHAACHWHVAAMKSRWTPEPPVPGVFVSAAEADELWPKDDDEPTQCLCAGIYGRHPFAADGCNFGPGRFRFHARYAR